MAPQLRSPTAAACADARFLCGVFRRPADSAQRALGGVLRAGQPRVRSRVGCIAARARCTELHQRFEQGACCGAPRRQRAVLPSSPPSSCSPRSSAPAAACHGDLSFSHLVVRRNRHSTTRGASRAARTVKGRGGGAQCWARAAAAAPRLRAAAPRRELDTRLVNRGAGPSTPQTPGLPRSDQDRKWSGLSCSKACRCRCCAARDCGTLLAALVCGGRARMEHALPTARRARDWGGC